MNRKVQTRGPAVVEQSTVWLRAQRLLGRSRKTLADYAVVLKNLRLFLRRRGITRITEIRPGDLAAWQRRLSGCAPATLDLFTRVVRQWSAWLVATDRLFDNPARRLTAPKYFRPLGRCPSEADMEHLIASVGGRGAVAVRDRALLETAYSTGARLEELTTLAVASVDLTNRLLRIRGKGGRDRMVPLTRPACRALKAYLTHARTDLLKGAGGRTALFIGSRGGRPMAAPAIAGVIKRRAATAGFKLAPHDIRRAFATHLLRGGAHPAVIRELLGHQTYRHLGSYLKLHPGDLIRTARASRISR